MMTPEKQFESVVARYVGDPQVTLPDAQSKKFGANGLKVGGKLFAMLVKGQLVIKLPKERVDSLVKSKAGKYFDPGHGRLMKEWIALQAGAKHQWLSLAEEAKAHVAANR